MRQTSVGHRYSKLAATGAAVAFALAACSSVVTPTPSASLAATTSLPSAAAAVVPSPTRNASASTAPRLTASPEMTPTPIPSLSGQYVGVLGWFSGCITLGTASSLYVIYLPSGYRLIHPSGINFAIVDANGNRVANDGDLVGLDAEPSHAGGSACQLGGPDRLLDLTRIVDVLPGTPGTLIDNWSVSCGATSQLDCQGVTDAFVNDLAWDALTVSAGTGRQLAVDTRTHCGLPLPSWGIGSSCWQANAPWPSSQSWQPMLNGRICEVMARGKVDGIDGFHQFAGDYLGGATIGPDWPPCAS